MTSVTQHSTTGAAGPVTVSKLAAVRAAVGAAADEPLWRLSEDQLVAEIGDALALKAQAEAVLLGRLAEADARGLARRRGAISMTGWLRGSHRVGAGEASRLVRIGRALRVEFPATGAALARGEVQLGQAEVIIDALHDLDADLGPAADPDPDSDSGSDPSRDEGSGSPVDLRADGEATLLEACGHHDPAEVGRLGRRLAELLDPDGVQARDEARIRHHEDKAHRRREFTLSPDPYGSSGRIGGRFDAAGGAIITAALDALAAPQPETPAGVRDPRSPAARRYDALVEVLRRHLHHPATSSGDGGKAQIRVTIPLRSLTEKVGVGVLDTGAEISPTLARMLACDAAIIPAVLNGSGQPIDLGRERRLFTGAARTAIEIRDGGCVGIGCTRPAAWTQIHHLIPWARGGRTDQTNGGLFCLHDHHLAETGEWQAMYWRGRIWLRPPARLDPQRRPRINSVHRPLPPRADWPPGAMPGPAR